jgi:hypothetical protein
VEFLVSPLSGTIGATTVDLPYRFVDNPMVDGHGLQDRTGACQAWNGRTVAGQ